MREGSVLNLSSQYIFSVQKTVAYKFVNKIEMVEFNYDVNIWPYNKVGDLALQQSGWPKIQLVGKNLFYINFMSSNKKNLAQFVIQCFLKNSQFSLFYQKLGWDGVLERPTDICVPTKPRFMSRCLCSMNPC